MTCSSAGQTFRRGDREDDTNRLNCEMAVADSVALVFDARSAV
jgi:hypothetical protein